MLLSFLWYVVSNHKIPNQYSDVVVPFKYVNQIRSIQVQLLSPKKKGAVIINKQKKGSIQVHIFFLYYIDKISCGSKVQYVTINLILRRKKKVCNNK